MKVKLTHVLMVLLVAVIIFNLGGHSIEGMRNKGVKNNEIPEGDEGRLGAQQDNRLMHIHRNLGHPSSRLFV